MSTAVGMQTVKLLRDISREDHLRDTILMNLLDEMGLDPILTHGPHEYGKDIICHETNKFGYHEWIAVVVKQGKITGSTSGSSSLQTVLNQIQEAMIHPYKHPIEKREVNINKVFVVTNDEIAETAREKLLEKLKSIGPYSPNIYFLDGSTLASLLDAHLPGFLVQRSDVLGSNDPMSKDVGLVLYLFARAYTLSTGRAKRRVDPDLSVFDVARYSHLSESVVREALAYLVKTQYLSDARENVYTIHPKVTGNRLLTNVNQIRLLFVLEKIANGSNHFSVEQAIRSASTKPLRFSRAFVRRTLAFLIKGGYIAIDESHGNGHFTVNLNMLEDERTYLNSWLTFRTTLPPPNQ